MSHSEAKPFSGGSPAIAIAPTRNAPPVHGMRRSRPPSWSSSSEPTAFSNAPAPRNSSALNTAWLSVCSSAAASAKAAHSSAPRLRSSRQAPSPSTMIPMFSIECSASSRLRSCWKSAYTTPPTAESAPSPSTRTPIHAGCDAVPLHEHAHERVDRDLDHHPAHQRRHRRRRDRMRAREPYVKRHHARLRPHPHQRRQCHRHLQPGAGRDRRRVADRSRLGQEQDRHPRPHPAEVRDRDVGEHDPPRRATSAVRDQDHDRRQQRHHLPEGEERQRVARAQDPCEHEHERGRQHGHRSAARIGAQVGRREGERRRRHHPERARGRTPSARRRQSVARSRS